MKRIGFSNGQINAITGYKFFRDDSALSHIFTKDNLFTDTAKNRNKLLDVANNSRYFLGKDKYGNSWNAVTKMNGTQVYTQSRNGKIFNGGVNKTPREFNPETGLSSPQRPKKSKKRKNS